MEKIKFIRIEKSLSEKQERKIFFELTPLHSVPRCALLLSVVGAYNKGYTVQPSARASPKFFFHFVPDKLRISLTLAEITQNHFNLFYLIAFFIKTNKKEIINKTAEHIKAKLSGEGSGHDWWHVYRVWKNAIHIGKHENVDLFVVELAVFLHDIADWKFQDGNEDVGPQLAKKEVYNADLSGQSLY